MALAVGMAAAACNKSGLEAPRKPVLPNGTAVSVSLTAALPETPFPGMQLDGTIVSKTTAKGNAMSVSFGSENTKASSGLATEEEQKIHNMWVIQFDKATGTLVGQPYYATAGQISQTGSAVSFEAKLTSAASPQTVYYVANTNSPTTFSADNCPTIAEMEKVCRRLTAEFKPTASSGLPMLAVQDCPAGIASGTPLTGAALRRLVAKVVLRYKVSPDFAGFTLTGVRLRNVPATIAYAAEKSGAVDFPVKDITYGNGSHFDYPVEDLTKATADGDYITFTWYMPENLRQAVTNVTSEAERTPDKTDGKATYIELLGDFKSPVKCERLSYLVLLGDAQNNVNDYNVRRNHIYTVSVTLEGRNMSDQRVSAEPFDMNNSAIVVPNSKAEGAVTFDIRKLTSGWQTAMPALGSAAALRAELLWTDNASLVSQLGIGLDKTNGLLTVQSNGSADGNAVIALYNNSAGGGDILWSWHIWVTGYKPDGGVDYTLGADSKAVVPGGEVHTYGSNYMTQNAGKVIMDRNLGATGTLYKLVATNAENYPTYGLFYQWGRKDPFPKALAGEVSNGNTGSTDKWQLIYNAGGVTAGYPALTQSLVPLGETVKNPLTYYYDPTGEWNSSPNDALWGEGGLKSAYDPCPNGWRIAQNGTWDDFDWGSSFGRNSDWAAENVDLAGGLYTAGNVKAFFPASGYLHPFSGMLYRVGNYGYVWSLSATGGGACSLYFNAAGVLDLRAGSYRAYGFPVRCIQE